jgi:DHA3 family macrolide efflux protein-like MFS transporter
MSRWSVHRKLLANPKFSSLWFGAFLSGLGDATVATSILWYMYEQTKSPLLVTLTLFCLELPAIIATPVWGIYLDRYSIRNFVVFSNLVQGCLFLVLITLTLSNPAESAIALLIIAISSCLAPITRTAQSMAVPAVVKQENLPTANSLMFIQFDAAIAIGPLISGLLLTSGHIKWSFAINAASFLLAALLYTYCFPKESHKVNPKPTERSGITGHFQAWKKDFSEGTSYIKQNILARNLIVLNFVWNLFIWGTLPTLLPIFTEKHLFADAEGYGVLASVSSIGILVGTFAAGAIKWKMAPQNIVYTSIGLHGLVYALLMFTPNVASAAVVILLCGIVSAPAMIYHRTILQTVVPKEKQGRVFSVSTTAGALGFPLGTVLASFYATSSGQTDPAFGFLAFGGFVLVSTGLLFFQFQQRNRIVQDVTAHEDSEAIRS